MSRPEITIQKNLSEAKKHESIARIIRESQLEEIIHCLNNSDNFSLAELYSLCFDKPLISDNMLSLCMRLTEKPHGTEYQQKEKATVAALKNPLVMNALGKLTKDIPTVILTEETDFRSCGESVSSEAADYCILPVCSSIDGYYPTFSKLIKAYDLKICKTVQISKSDSDEEIEFALLSKETEIHKHSKFAVFSFTEEDKSSLPKLLTAFYENDVAIISVQSSPLEFNMARFEHRIVISLDHITIEALLLFLDVSLPGHTLLGIY